MTIEVIRLTVEQVRSVQEQIVRIYVDAFAEPPYNGVAHEAAQFRETLNRHLHREGFRCVVGRENTTGVITGFAYGYTSHPGQWWHDLVAHTLGASLTKQWLADAFEFVEFAVHPRYQGRGIGGQIHDTILSGLPHRTAILSTYQANSTGLQLYRQRGWVTLYEHFYFPGYDRPYRIMGLALTPVSPSK